MQQRWERGEPASTIAHAMGVSCSLVLSTARRQQWPKHSHGGKDGQAALRDALAELVADGRTVDEAGAAMGLTVPLCDALWRRICSGLGPQAC